VDADLASEYEPYQEDMERITPDSTEQLTTFVLTKGTIIGQAGLAVLDPLVGKTPGARLHRRCRPQGRRCA